MSLPAPYSQETVEHREEVRQEEQPFPLICVSSNPKERVEDNITIAKERVEDKITMAKKRVDSNITLHSYTHLGLWHRENETVEQTYDRLSYKWNDLGTDCLLNV